jgi:hypothetical protein
MKGLSIRVSAQNQERLAIRPRLNLLHNSLKYPVDVLFFKKIINPKPET